LFAVVHSRFLEFWHTALYTYYSYGKDRDGCICMFVDN
jgi:hypothetical protein